MALTKAGVVSLLLAFAAAQGAGPAHDWRFYNGDAGSSRYSPLSQIDRSNVRKLRPAWVYHTGDKSDEPKTTIECTPIVVNGVMYVTSPQLKVIALNPGTGTPIWIYDPFTSEVSLGSIPPAGLVAIGILLIWVLAMIRRRYRANARTVLASPAQFSALIWLAAGLFPAGFAVLRIIPDFVAAEKLDPWRVNRGVTYWQDGADRRILFVAGHRLIALRSDTGAPIREFGNGGEVDLRHGLGRDITGANYMVTSPGVIYRNLIILGSKTGEGPRPEAPGHVRAFDVRSGKQVWIFHTIPHPGEFGYDTWSPDYWKTGAGANDWAGMSVDEKRGMVFLATGSPTFDFYGGNRIGQNLFGDSVVALKAATGERVWHFQAVHHNLWDYDLPCPPMLVTVQQNGRAVDAVAQLTKMGWLFLLDRETGRPLFPVEERPVPPSAIPGESAWPTQPFPVKPPPFVRQSLTDADLTDISPRARQSAREQLRTFEAGNIYVPPGRRPTVEFPGIHGGANWSGGSFDPATGLLFVNANELPYLVTLVKSKFTARFPFLRYPYDHTGYSKFLDPDGYPAVKPPWGTLNAIDLARGERAWQIPLGEYPELTAKGIPLTGTENFGGSIVTAGGLVFVAGTRDEKFRAFDKSTGQQLWEAKLEAGGYATPCTYEAGGRQYIAIAAGGGGQLATKPGDAYIAFALPRAN